MKSLRLTCSIPVLCRALQISRSGCYARLVRPLSQHARDEARLEVEIKAAHRRTRQTCGPERLRKDLAAHGVSVGILRIRRIRKKPGIRCKQTRKFKATTDSGHSFPVAANLLKQNFAVEAPNQVWVSDLTYIATEEGWLYCAAYKDLFHGEIVGYALRTGNHEATGRTIPSQGRAGQTAGSGPYPPFRPWQSVLQPEIPDSS